MKKWILGEPITNLVYERCAGNCRLVQSIAQVVLRISSFKYGDCAEYIKLVSAVTAFLLLFWGLDHEYIIPLFN